MRRSVLDRIPLALVYLRLLLAPVMLLLAVYRPEPAAFAACLVTAFLSDLFDGIIARRLGVATPGLRRLDSCADTLFYLSALAAVWWVHPDLIRGYGVPLTALLALEVARYVLDWIKFRREASYHCWSAKLWGVALFVAFAMALVAGKGDPWVAIAITLGLVSDAEGLLISLVLPVWRHDVPSLVHAWRIRSLRSADSR